MKPDLNPATCPSCGTTAVLVAHTTRFRRGGQTLVVDTWTWACQSGCSDPTTGEAPYHFTVPALMKWTDKRAQQLWQDRFGMPMPASRRGRRPGQNRSVRVPVMLTPKEADQLDELRGGRSRSEFLRDAIHQPSRKTG